MTWDSYADTWDDDAGARAYAAAAFDSVTRICTARSFRLTGARICDFGCGTGLLTERLAPICAVVVALDTSQRMIERLRHKIDRLGLTNVHTTTASIDQAVRGNRELFQHPFDLVVCSSVCAFLDDYAGTVRTLVQQVRPGGLWMQWDWELDPGAPEPFGLTRAQIEATLARAGLEAIEVTTAFEVSLGDETARPLMGVGQVPSSERPITPV